jgi:thiol:disulfide interchange protein DsbD
MSSAAHHRPLIWLVTLFAICQSVHGQFGVLPGAGVASEARLVPEAKAVAPGGKFSVALELRHPDGWHSYYLNSGGVEQAPALRWTLPAGFVAGPIQWPTPAVKEGFLGQSFVYEGSPVFLTEISAPAGIAAGESLTFSAEATWQICKESCINEEKSFTFTLPVAEATQMDPAAVELFDRARASLPAQPVDASFAVTEDGAEHVLLRVGQDAAPGAEFTDFVPDQPFVKSAGDGGSISRDGDAWRIRLARARIDAFDKAIPQGDVVSGILLGARPLKVPLTRISAPEPEPAPLSEYLKILGGMLLGGLILNLMPCVFPVIGLKIMGFVQQAGSNRRKIVLHGWVFTLGVLVSFLVLSGILFTARAAAGDAVEWGYQLQDPRVVLALMVLMFLLALNLFGIFEIGTSATSVGSSLLAKQGFAGSFFSGVLATVVATPCSAPFLGAAIGAAIALPTVQFFAAFTTMGIGLALPYLVLSAFPKLIGFLPRPGAWMESFKQAMSFLLFATAGYLLWVYAGQIGLENLLGPLFGLSAIALAAWVYGRWNLPHRKASTRMTARIVAVLFAGGGLLLALPPRQATADQQQTAAALVWETWSQQRVDDLLAEGTPVYIDFTAQWCLTCQVNKKRAYTPQVVALFEEKGVVALKADKTVRNPEIDAALRRFGRSAIPVNVLLAPGREPLILPELLAPDDLLKALKDL